jgi:hypothetical protein
MLRNCPELEPMELQQALTMNLSEAWRGLVDQKPPGKTRAISTKISP